MAFCTQSKESRLEGYSPVENAFLETYLPQASELQLKVYLYGYYLSCNADAGENSADALLSALGIDQAQALEAFSYWEGLGLVTIAGYEPLRVVYRGAKNGAGGRKYKKEKYADFNRHLESIFKNSPPTNINQYLPYYDFMEETKLAPEVLAMIAGYCVNKKGERIGANYIIAVARNWMAEGVRTMDDAEKRIRQLEITGEKLVAVARALGKKSEIELEDRQLYAKWTTAWGFGDDAILAAAEHCKKKGGMNRLDTLLDEYFRHNCMSVAEIRSYAENKKRMRELAVKIVKTLGLWYDNVDYIVEKYVTPWLAKGFEKVALEKLADHCFLTSVRTLEGMNAVAEEFCRNGCLTGKSVDEYLAQQRKTDEAIRALIRKTGSTRRVTANDRELYRLWTYEWQSDAALVAYACTLAEGRPYAFGYVNMLLSKWRAEGIVSAEDAKRRAAKSTTGASAEFNADDRPAEEAAAADVDLDAWKKLDI